MKKLYYLLFFLSFSCNVSNAKDKPLVGYCNIVHDESVSLKITFTNLSESIQYIYASYWYLDGVSKNSPGLLAMPSNRGVFLNQVYYFEKNIESSGARGSIEGSPRFNFFPKVIELKPSGNYTISIDFYDELSEMLKNDQFEYDVFVKYSDDIIEVDLNKYDILFTEKIINLDINSRTTFSPNSINIGLSNFPYDENESGLVWNYFSEELYITCN